MTNQVNDEYVDSSYTTLYLIFTVGYSIFVSFAFGDATFAVLFAIMGYALLSYFVWDVIRQLFYPGQAVFLYVITFLVLPSVINLSLSNSVGTIAIIIYVAANVSALLFDSIYELILKKRLPKKVLSKLLYVDSKIDKSIVPLSIKHVQFTEFKGLTIALGLIGIYFVAVMLLPYR